MVKREDSGKLVSDFERLLDSWVLSSAALEHWTLKQFLRSTLTDVKIKCEGKILECHKAILSARCVLILCNYWLIRLTLWECFQSIRSSVFRAMFQHDMRESKSNEIIIPDLDFNTVKDMVRYVYSGRWKMWEYFLLFNFLGCRVSDLPDKSDLLLSAADKYDIRWSWMVNVVPFSRIQFQSKTKNNYHPKYPPKTRERSPWKSPLAIVTYKSAILFSLQRLEGRMLSVIVSQPCRWPGDLIQLSWSGSATQVWCKTDGIFLGCWYFGPLRLAQGCGVENHCHIISSCP